MKPGHYIIIGVVVVLLLVGTFVASRLLNPISQGTIQADLTAMPPDDSQLQKWLSAQPTLKKYTVTRSGSSLTVVYKMPGRETDAESYAPRVTDEMKQLGYQLGHSTTRSEYNPLFTE